MARRHSTIDRIIEATIEKLDERGYGISNQDNKEYRILNALPGEKVQARVFKKKRRIQFAETLEIFEKSKLRIEPKEDHFMSCAPWQIIEVKDEQQIKHDLIEDFFKEQNIILPEFTVDFDGNDYDYRNKVEFAFFGHPDDHVTLAYHKRENGFHKHPINECLLMPNDINITAQKIIDLINAKHISARQLKGLLMRYSFSKKQIIAAIFVKDKTVDFTQKDIDGLVNETLIGVKIIDSDPRSPAFINTDIVIETGESDMHEDILDKELSYPYYGFFQINPPAFSRAVQAMRKNLSSIPNIKTMNVIDLYAGVGTIGLCIADLVNKVTGVELTPGTKEYALKNAEINNIKNFDFYEGKSEGEGLNYISSCDILIVDPPRAGLHQKLIDKIIEFKPKYIIYLSCNPKTQAENLMQLVDIYNINYFEAFNFYPHTPHVESLAVLGVR